MNHDELKNKIPDLIAGHLKPTEEALIRKSLKECESCQDYYAAVSSYYALEIEILPELPLSALPDRSLPVARRPFLRVGAAAAAILILLFALHASRDGAPTEGQGGHEFKLELISVEAPHAPDWSQSRRWISDEAYARALSAYSGIPLVQAYSYVLCPRAIALKPHLDALPEDEMMEGFIGLKVDFEDQFPPALMTRQDEVKDTMAIHTPVVIVTHLGNDFPAKYDVTGMSDIKDYLSTWKQGHGDTSHGQLVQSEYEGLRMKLDSVPESLTVGKWGQALNDLEDIMGFTRTRLTRFTQDAVDLRAQIIAEIDARIASCQSRLSGEPDGQARAEMKAMIKALDGHEKANEIRRFLN